MNLKNFADPQRKIDGREDAGQTGLCVGLFFLVFLAVLLISQLQLEQIRASDDYLQDALAASGLAALCARILGWMKTGNAETGG